MRKNVAAAVILWCFVLMATAPQWWGRVFPDPPQESEQTRKSPRVEGLVASFTATAVSGKLAANQTDFIWYFDLSNAPAAFWTAIDADGANMRVFDSGDTRLPLHVVSFDKDAETGWIAFKADGLSGSDNVFTIDTDGSLVAPDAQYGSESVWSAFTRVQAFGEVWDDATGAAAPTAGPEPGMWEQASQQAVSTSATQGIAWDGTFYYLSGNNFLIKYNSSWVSQATNTDPAGDLGIAGLDHLGDLDVHDGVIYVIVADQAGGPTEAHLATYDASDLSFIDAFDLAGIIDPNSAGVWYNPDDDLIYAVDRATNDVIRKIDPVSETLDSSINLSRALLDPNWLIQGLTGIGGKFYVSAGEPEGSDPGGIIVIDADGTVHPTPAHVSGHNNQQGIATKGAEVLLLVGSPPNVRTLQRVSLDMALGAGAGLNAAGNVFPTYSGMPSETAFTIGATALSDGNGTNSSTLASYIDEDAPEGNNDHIKFGEHDPGGEWGVNDQANGWTDSGVAVSTVTAQRIHWTYNHPTNRKIYVDGGLEVTDSTLSDPGYAGFDALFIGREDAGEFNLFSGKIGFLYFYPGELDSNWISDEYDQLSDNANFWTVAEVEDESAGFPKLGLAPLGLTPLGLTPLRLAPLCTTDEE